MRLLFANSIGSDGAANCRQVSCSVPMELDVRRCFVDRMVVRPKTYQDNTKIGRGRETNKREDTEDEKEWRGEEGRRRT